MNCPNCNSADKWRCPVYQSVDVEVGKDFHPIDNGLDFTSPELEKEKVFCNNCGYKPFVNETEKENEIMPHLKDILDECKGRRMMEQIEHNVFEIAEHLGIKLEELQNERVSS